MCSRFLQCLHCANHRDWLSFYYGKCIITLAANICHMACVLMQSYICLNRIRIDSTNACAHTCFSTQAFYSPQGIYLLVFDLTRDLNEPIHVPDQTRGVSFALLSHALFHLRQNYATARWNYLRKPRCHVFSLRLRFGVTNGFRRIWNASLMRSMSFFHYHVKLPSVLKFNGAWS